MWSSASSPNPSIGWQLSMNELVIQNPSFNMHPLMLRVGICSETLDHK